ncbi:MAG: Holliday junction branch migration protein RuvA [Roseovarius pacificus]|nr:Holliday junction branch migration protein RuvA [Roseovarius pacificus]
MIGRLAGRIDYRATDHVLIDVRGVGYLVYCSDRTLQALPRVGEHVALYTDLVVREDLLQLFGFTSLLEKEWHRLLMSVQGVGAKASLAILGTLGPEGVGRAIALGDWNAVKAAKGIGPKTAQRVVNELKDKVPEIMAMGASTAPASAPAAPAPDADEVIEPTPAPAPAAAPPAPSNAQAEALSALTNLGYAPGEAASAVAQAASDDAQADTAALIRAALRLLAPKG